MGTLLRLLLSLRLGELASYFTVVSKMLHGEYTPDVAPDEYYISLIVVDENMRGKGIGSFLLGSAIEKARPRDAGLYCSTWTGRTRRPRAIREIRLRALRPEHFPGPWPGPPRTVTLELGLA